MSNLNILVLDRKSPILVSLVCLFYIYVLQLPLSQMLADAVSLPDYGIQDWVNAYLFASLSAIIFVSAIFFSLKERVTISNVMISFEAIPIKKLSMPIVFLLVTLFALWSYLMVSYKIGITIYSDFDPLPYHLTGALFYGRLLLQPLTMAYLAMGFRNSKNKWIVFVFLVLLGSWVSMASGSRFIALLFSVPLMLLFNGRKRYVIAFLVFLAFVTVATLSRSLYLPYVIGGEYILIYANDQYVDALLENLYMLPISYVIYRPMGMGELLMTLDYGQITTSFYAALQKSFAYFFPFLIEPPGVSIKNIYGLNDDAFGGFSLDMFSIFWLSFGGNWFLYIAGLIIIGFLLGKTYIFAALGLEQLGLRQLQIPFFILLFILAFEGRGFLMPWLFLASWIFSRDWVPRAASRLLSLFR